MKILIADGIEKTCADILLKAGFELTQKTFTPDDLLVTIGDHNAIIVRSATKVTKNVIDAGTNLKVIARGSVVNERDLLDALNSHKVKYAALDVYEHEPPTPEEYDFIAHPRVSVTPHIGGSTMEAQDRVGVEIAEKVVATLGEYSTQEAFT